MTFESLKLFTVSVLRTPYGCWIVSLFLAAACRIRLLEANWRRNVIIVVAVVVMGVRLRLRLRVITFVERIEFWEGSKHHLGRRRLRFRSTCRTAVIISITAHYCGCFFRTYRWIRACGGRTATAMVVDIVKEPLTTLALFVLFALLPTGIDDNTLLV